jgi:hypothetical protein
VYQEQPGKEESTGDGFELGKKHHARQAIPLLPQEPGRFSFAKPAVYIYISKAKSTAPWGQAGETLPMLKHH